MINDLRCALLLLIFHCVDSGSWADHRDTAHIPLRCGSLKATASLLKTLLDCFTENGDISGCWSQTCLTVMYKILISIRVRLLLLVSVGDDSPDIRSSYRGCHMIGSGNMPFPRNMTLWHPRRSIDDPRWSLTALTRDPQGSKQPVPAVTRESAPLSVVWDAVGVSEFGRRASDPEGPLWRFHIPPICPRKQTHLVY